MSTDLDDLVDAARAESAHAPDSTGPGTGALFARLEAETSAGAHAPLAEFVDAARAAVREDLVHARTSEIPPRSRRVKPTARRLALWLAVAAGLLLAAGLGARFGPALIPAKGPSTGSEAVFSVQDEGTPATASRQSADRKAPPAASLEQLRPESEPATEQPGPAESESPSRPDRGAARPGRRLQPPAREDPSPSERLARLDERAQAAWRAGELDEARVLFNEVVRVGGRSHAVEVAFGELFTLARQTGGEERVLWRRYLARFPNGRHADDARAGLCQLETTGRATCWRAYLEDFPKGAHAGLARDAVAAEQRRGGDGP